VDFTAAARAAEKAGLTLAGFTDQHHALTALSARTFPAMAETRLSPDAAREMRALRQLLHPESMGTSFKFLALSRQTNAPLTAFQFARDPRQ
jgi:SAM-dependent MidA family methyltransferase